MKSTTTDNQIELKTQFLEMMLQSFPIEEYMSKWNNEKDICNDIKEYIEKNYFACESIIVNAPITVTVGNETLRWCPDLLIKDNSNVCFFIEIKYTKNLLDYGRIKQSLASIMELTEVREKKIVGGILVTINPSINNIITYPICRLDIVPDVQIYETSIGKGNKKAKIAVFKADVNAKSPNDILDKAIGRYTNSKPFNQFRDIYIDNPWIRIVISNIDALPFAQMINQHM